MVDWRKRMQRGTYFSNAPLQPFTGQVSDKGFTVLRQIRARNSFQTEAIGRFEPDGGGTRVETLKRVLAREP